MNPEIRRSVRISVFGIAITFLAIFGQPHEAIFLIAINLTTDFVLRD